MQWSFSRLNTYENCPRRFFHQYVEKSYREPPQEHLTWGTRVHTEMEERVRDKKPLSQATAKWEPYAKTFDDLRDNGAIILVEQKLGINKDGEVFVLDDIDDERAWGRGIIDVLAADVPKALIADYKTGKVKKDFTQLHIFAKLVFGLRPDIEVAKLMYIWLKFNKVTTEEVTREQIERKWENIVKRVQAMEDAVETGKFPERPSGLCGWCYARQCNFCPN